MSRHGGIRQLSRYCASLIAVLFFIGAAIRPANAFCGYDDKELAKAKDFIAENPGALALKLGEKYFILRRSNCTKFGSISTQMHFYVNHLNITTNSERAFLSVHAALLDPSDLRNIIYLYRNAKNNQQWDEDKNTQQDYSSLHNSSHTDFNSDLALTRKDFDAKYRNGKRLWNDKVSNGDSVYETWDTRNNFVVRNDLINVITNKRGGLRVQNYFINFVTGAANKDDPLQHVPDFTMDAAGAKCILVRIAGSANVSAAVTGEYVVALNGTDTCDSAMSELRGIGFFEYIFGFRH